MIAVVLGAFAAHGLNSIITAESLRSFETGVRYQMYHALFLLILPHITYISANQKKRVYYFILAGLILFSGSIYVLATNNLTSIDFRPFGIVTPVGGLLIITGWLLLLVYVLRNRAK
ncbi:MAG: DUF423 domain-containing protein [Winogradskyella sp.]|nr:DUF423 domain-containing protein [Winogradskyella sp.]